MRIPHRCVIQARNSARERLARGHVAARGFAVVDLETTGIGQLCRIAAVHGIDERLAAGAPNFAAVAPTLAVWLKGRVVVVHNLDRGCLRRPIRWPILRQHFTVGGQSASDSR